MRKYFICFLVVLSIILSGARVVLAQGQVDKINSLLQKGTWKLTYHDTGMRWRGLEFYTFQNTTMVDVEYYDHLLYREDETSMLYQAYRNTIRFICPELFAPFPENFKAKIVKLSERVLMLKVGRGLDVFLREDVKPNLPPASLKKCWYGKGEKVEVKLCFHNSRVEFFSRKKNSSSSFIKIGDFSFEFFDLGIPSIVRIDFGKNVDDFLFYPRKIIEEGEGMTLIPVPAKPVPTK